MSSAPNAHDVAPTSAPGLPPNVSIFSPANSRIAKSLINGRLFTRLTTSTQTSPAQLASALRSSAHESFCLVHGNVILIFDGDDDIDGQIEGKDFQDEHHEHFRTVCLVLKEKDISLSVSACIFDASNALGAGFQFDELNSGSVLVIDLMNDDQDEGDDEDEDEDEDEDDDADSSGGEENDQQEGREQNGKETGTIGMQNSIKNGGS